MNDVVNTRIVFFDGKCRLCNASLDFILRYDRSGLFSFADLGSPAATAYLSPVSLLPLQPESIIYFREGVIYNEADAVLKILSDMGGIWKASSILYLVPAGLRNRVYRLIARKRYQWFGSQDSCRLHDNPGTRIFPDK